MIQYICSIYFSEKNIVILSDKEPHHTICCEILDSDGLREAAGKRQVFAHKCDALSKCLKAIYPYVVMKKVRTQIIDIS